MLCFILNSSVSAHDTFLQAGGRSVNGLILAVIQTCSHQHTKMLTSVHISAEKMLIDIYIVYFSIFCYSDNIALIMTVSILFQVLQKVLVRVVMWRSVRKISA